MVLYGPQCKKTCFPVFGDNKGADQPLHPLSLIRTFVIRLLESIILKLAPSEISQLKLVSDFSMTLLETR